MHALTHVVVEDLESADTSNDKLIQEMKKEMIAAGYPEDDIVVLFRNGVATAVYEPFMHLMDLLISQCG